MLLNNSLLNIIIYVSFFFSVFFIVFFVLLFVGAKKTIANLTIEKKKLSEILQNISDEKIKLEVTLTQERKLMSEKIEWLKITKETLSRDFNEVSQSMIQQTAAQVRDKHHEVLQNSLSPLRTQITDFNNKVTHVYEKESEQRIQLKQEILQLKSLNQQLSQDAINLTTALSGQNKVQGLWGEVILERVLECSGLSTPREYELQVMLTGEANARLMPDAVIYLPDNRAVVVDAKVSLIAYQQVAQASSEEEKLKLIKQHIKSVDSHIKNLSDKNYSEYLKSHKLDFVLLFIPIESAFLLAIEHDDSLLERAFKQNIMLVCPSTLLISLRTIHNMWRFEDQNRHAVEIADQAGNLYDKFVGFVGQLEKIGHELKQANYAYDTAYKQLVSGKGSLVTRAEKIRKLGANSKKRLAVTTSIDEII